MKTRGRARPEPEARAPVEPGIEDHRPSPQQPPRLRAFGSGELFEVQSDGLPAVTTDGSRFAALVTEWSATLNHGGHDPPVHGEDERLLLLVDVVTGKPAQTFVVYRAHVTAKGTRLAKAQASSKRAIWAANEQLAAYEWLELVDGGLTLPHEGDRVTGRAGQVIVEQTRWYADIHWPGGVEDLEQSFHGDFAHCEVFALAAFETGNQTWWAVDTFALPEGAQLGGISDKSCPSRRARALPN